MKHLPSHYLFLLKVSTISVSGIVIVKPEDCLEMQSSINAITGRFVSLIALRRIFGFEKALFGPSLYTLNLLASYCAYEDWGSFCDYQDLENNLSHKKPI